MTIIQLSLENFQIYENFFLNLQPGLTIITGPSNSGKSSIIRSLSTLILNPSSNLEDIHTNKDYMKISLNIDNKKYIYQKSSNEGVSYTLDDSIHTKIGRANIFDLDKSFPFVLDEEDNILNIQGEWNQMFPFDRKESGLFKLFEDVFALINSTDLLRLFNSEQTKIKREIQETAININKFSNIIDEIDKLADFNLVEIEDLFAKLNELNSINYSIIDLNYISELNFIDNSLFYVLDSLNSLLDLDDLNNVKAINNIDLIDFELITLDYIEYIENLNIINTIDISNQIIPEYLELFNEDINLKTINSCLLKLDELKHKLTEIKICPLCNNIIGG